MTKTAGQVGFEAKRPLTLGKVRKHKVNTEKYSMSTEDISPLVS